MPKNPTDKTDPGAVTTTAPTVTTPTNAKPAEAVEFIILVRSARGTLHPILDKNKGPGACATFETIDLALLKRDSIPDCTRFPSVIVPVPVN